MFRDSFFIVLSDELMTSFHLNMNYNILVISSFDVIAIFTYFVHTKVATNNSFLCRYSNISKRSSLGNFSIPKTSIINRNTILSLFYQSEFTRATEKVFNSENIGKHWFNVTRMREAALKYFSERLTLRARMSCIFECVGAIWNKSTGTQAEMK